MSGHAISTPAGDDLESATLRIVRNRCIPILALAFIVSYLDRVNVGVAALTANKDLGLTPAMFGYGAGLVSIGYAFFELPSNLAMERFGARKWLARIMITWGIIGCCMVLVRGPLSFYAVRFLLGAAEAGLFPGVILYLTYWFPRRHRARYIALFALAIPMASVIGSPISGMLLGMNGILGMRGWQWLFILEAVPAIVLGVLVLLLLTDRPSQASWLTREQKAWLETTLDQERRAHPETRRKAAWKMLGDSRVLVLAGIFFLTGVPSYGLAFWLPQIVKTSGLSNTATGFVAAIPFLVGCFAMVWWASFSDRLQERAWNTAAAAFVGFLGLVIGALAHSLVMELVGVCIAAIGIFGLKGPWLAMITEAFADKTAAAGIAWVSTLGSLSGFFAPWMVGLIIQHTHDYHIALMALGINSLLGAGLVLAWAWTGGRRYQTLQIRR